MVVGARLDGLFKLLSLGIFLHKRSEEMASLLEANRRVQLLK